MAEQGQVGISRIYVKDLSFESPLAPEIFRTAFQPEIKVEVTTRHQQIEGPLYEVSLEVTVTGVQKEKNAFVVEVELAGLFQVQVPEQHLAHVLKVYCPGVLFPYVRQNIDSSMVSGGFPPIMLPAFNFEALAQSAGKPN